MAVAARGGIRITFDPDLNMVYVGTGNGAPGVANSAARPAATTSISPRWSH